MCYNARSNEQPCDRKAMTTVVYSSWPVVGHDWAVQQLTRSLRAEESLSSGLRHAYLFLGPRQIGKSTFVRAFAQALLCTDETTRPCGRCRSCTLLARGAHPDFRLVQPLDKELAVDRLHGTLRGEQATDLVRDVSLRPVEGRIKVIAIQDVHTANATFANKLLKTLEEPPAHVILCLTATDRTLVLPTVVSRCQIFELRPLDPLLVEQVLVQQWRTPAEQARLLARLSAGRLGWAVEWLSSKDGWQERQTGLETLWRLMGANRVDRLVFAEQLAASRNSGQIVSVIELWSSWCRDLMLVQSGCREACSNVDQEPVLLKQAGLLTAESVRDFLRTLQEIGGYLEQTTVNSRLALDVLLLQLPALAQPIA